jgi:hypothetical protein
MNGYGYRSKPHVERPFGGKISKLIFFPKDAPHWSRSIGTPALQGPQAIQTSFLKDYTQRTLPGIARLQPRRAGPRLERPCLSRAKSRGATSKGSGRSVADRSQVKGIKA